MDNPGGSSVGPDVASGIWDPGSWGESDEKVIYDLCMLYCDESMSGSFFGVYCRLHNAYIRT